MSDTCIFCRIVKKELPSKIVLEDDIAFAIEDIKPQAPVHILIVPKKHIEAISTLSDEDEFIAAHLILTAKKVAKIKGIADSGYRLILNCGKDAGQDVPHVHLHLMGGRKFSWPPG